MTAPLSLLIHSEKHMTKLKTPSKMFYLKTPENTYLEGFDSYFGHMLLVNRKQDAKLYREKHANMLCEKYSELEKIPHNR